MNTFLARTSAEWRAWLEQHGRTEREVWLVIHHKDSATPSVRYHEAIEHALCFGWIDSHARKHDADSSLLRFTPRAPRSSWSRVNRERAGRMIEQGLMTDRGHATIEVARSTGTWQVVPDDLTAAVPVDLRASLETNAAARDHFARFPPSSQRLILEWVASAKRPETRQRRIDRTVELAAVGVRANHPGVRMRDAG
jgi:uncharacterized protein YdeI (YjbR/CyaY-like superfamily)